KSLYISNKTRNPKVKGYNEFVNNVVYNWGNAGNTYNHSVSGDGYIMGGSAGVSAVNVINNYFIGGSHAPERASPFSRGTGTFYLYADGNIYDNNKNGILDGKVLSANAEGYPGLGDSNFREEAFPYPFSKGFLSAAEAFEWVSDNAGATLPQRDEPDQLLIKELKSKGKEGLFVFTEADNKIRNGGLGRFEMATAPADTDKDGIPDSWEKKLGLDPDQNDALAPNSKYPGYLNIEIYI